MKDQLNTSESPESWPAFSYADEVPGFWEEAKANHYKKGNLKTDCDAKSVKLYDQMMEWLDGKELPDGQVIHLTRAGKYLLKKEDIRLSGDNVFTRFTGRVPDLMDELEEIKGSEWKAYQQRIIRNGWRIGGEILFPRHRNSLNGMRGFSRQIMDRFDLTLECIQNFYEDKNSPLSWVLEMDREWFELFVNFQGFIDFFLLNDWVDENYQVIDQLGTGNLLPETVSELEAWHIRMEELVEARTLRIVADVCKRKTGKTVNDGERRN